MGEGLVGFRYVVSGKVQGVFFRASAAREAVRLGVRGHALNLPDGRVEVLAVGTPAAVGELRRWLGRGPPAARVDRVEEVPVPPAAHAGVRGFTTG
jgi:acylphosphatase